MIVDRDLQKKILETAKEIYPNRCYENKNKDLWAKEVFIPNVVYLAESGLLEADYHESSRSPAGGTIMYLRITNTGIDFLEDDGGLSAILNKVVIKFDEEDLAKFLSVKLAESNLSSKEKESIMATIKRLPAQGIKTVYTHLLNLGLKNLQDIPRLIERISENL